MYSQKLAGPLATWLLSLATMLVSAQTNAPFSISGPNSVCVNECGTFTVVSNTPGGAGIASVTWSNGVSSQTAPHSAQYCFSSAGSYSITAVVVSVNGQSWQLPPHQVIVPEICTINNPLSIVSNAAAICPANALPDTSLLSPPEGFTLTISNGTSAPYGQVCLEVRVHEFLRITAMQLSIRYDPARLQFASVGQFAVPGMSAANNFGLPVPGGAGMTQPGVITLSWFLADSLGFTLPDGSVLFRMCFQALPGACSTEVSFSHLPTPIAILGGFDNQELPFEGRPGQVRITGAASGSNTGGSGCCEQVCEGAVVEYVIQGALNSTVIPVWTIRGASSFRVDTLGTKVTVVWGLAGQGSVTVAVSNSTAQLCVDILALPQASFTSLPASANDTLQVCQGQAIDFQNTSIGAARVYWLLGDGSTRSTQVFSYAYPAPGAYRLGLIAENACGCADTTWLTVVVAPTPAPQITCKGTVCEGTTATYTTDAACIRFLWSVSSHGTVVAGGGMGDNFITIDWHTGPEGIVELQVEDCGGSQYCASPNVMRIPILSDAARIQGPQQVCRGATTRYRVTPYEGTQFTWAVSALGSIVEGQGTAEVVVQWSNLLNNQPQWVAVQFDNCYLDCSGRDTLAVYIRPEWLAFGPPETCLNTAQSYTARRNDTGQPVLCHWEVLTLNGAPVWTSPAPTATPSVPWDFGVGRFRLVARPTIPADYCTVAYEVPVQVLALPQPLSGIAGPLVVCPGRVFNYQAHGMLLGHSIQWRAGGHNGSPATGSQSINLTWSAIGPYSLSAAQVSPQGCASPPISIVPTPLSGLSISGASEVCAGQTALYTAPVLDGFSYQWSISPASAGAILRNDSTAVQILWHSAGVATLSVSACGQSTSMTVNVQPPPMPEVLHPGQLCSGDSATVQTIVPFDSYQWKNPQGYVMSTAPMPRLPAGFYSLEVTTANGCKASTSFRIEAIELPQVTLSTPDNTGICPGDPPSQLFATMSEAGFSYRWYRDGTLIPGATQPTYSTAELGTYQVEAISTNGCRAFSDTLALFFYCASGGGGGFPGGGFPGGGGGNPALCPPNSAVSFDILPTPDCHVSQFVHTSPSFIPGSLLWNFGDPTSGPDNFSTLDNPVHTFSRAGFFRVALRGLVAGVGLCYAFRVDTVPVAPSFEFVPSCAGDTVYFKDATTFIPGERLASWHWDFGDPASNVHNTDTLANPAHVYSTPGIYTVTLTTTAANGCVASVSRQVEVFDGPALSFDLPNGTCAASAILFTAIAGSEVSRLNWNFGDPASGTADSSSPAQTYHRYTAPGVYTASLEGRNAYGCRTVFSRDVDVRSNTLSGSIGFASPICEGDSTLLTAPAGGLRWLWSTGDTTISIWAKQEGLYSVTVTNADGCTYEPAIAAVQVIPAPANVIRSVLLSEAGFPVGYQYDSICVCAGQDVFLEALSRPGQILRWSTGSSAVRIEFSEARGNRLPVGVHDIFLSVTETTTDCVNRLGPFRISVRPLPDVPLLNASPPGNVCEGTPATFMVANPQPGVSYSWSSGVQGISFTTSQAGQYRAVAVNEWGCTSMSQPQTVLPGPKISLIPSGCHSRCNPDTLCFPQVPESVSYQWFFQNAPLGAPSSSAPQLVATQSGAYYLRITTSQGCTLDSDPLNLSLYDGYGRFRGTVYWDRNNNGALDAADSLMTNVPLILLSNNTPVDTVRSQSSGQYGFINILSQSYRLLLDTTALPSSLRADWTQIDTALVGCDDEVIINWRLRCVQTTATLTLNACPGSTVMYQGVALTPGSTTNFALTNSSGCDSIVTVTVNALPTSTSTLTLNACPGSTVMYQGVALTPGSTTNFALTNSSGCDSIVTVTVNALPEIQIQPPVVEASCANRPSGRITFTAIGQEPFQYSLNGTASSATGTFFNLPAGNYSLVITDANGCTAQHSIVLPTQPPLQITFLNAELPCGADSAVVEIQLLSGDDGQVRYRWDNRATTPWRSIREPGHYTVQVSNSCDTLTQTVAIRYAGRPDVTPIFIPNAFSPNEDGINDLFKAYISTEVAVPAFELMVFDRWGNLMFRTQNPNEGWNGVFRERAMDPAVFVWHLRATVLHCGRLMLLEQKGDVTLVR